MHADLKLQVLQGSYTIHRLSPGTQPDPAILESLSEGFCSITSTQEELSVVLPDETQIKSEKSSKGWKCLMVVGPLDLQLTGILNELTRPLKEKGLSVFAISTYDTDYLLIPGSQFEPALEVLGASYEIERSAV